MATMYLEWERNSSQVLSVIYDILSTFLASFPSSSSCLFSCYKPEEKLALP